ncbi:MAG: hypothetical protein II309_00375 [Bacilli bacterium]|nr:hypothetical protein [Bacilli bacterium]
MMSLIRKMFISMFCYIDRIIYFFVEKMYELFILISEAGIFSQATIQEFATRIYVFLGLIMIFQVSISLVNYIINPSTFDDKTIGGAALIKNAAIALVGIVLVPYVFEAAYSLQRIVLKENVIGNLILGVKTWKSQEEAESYVAYGGRKMAFSTFSSFVTFNPEVASSTCVNEPVLISSNDLKFNNDACGQIGEVPFDSGVKDEEGNELTTVGQYMEYVYKTGEVKTLANADLLVLQYKSTDGDYDLFDYSYLISCIAGAFLIYILFKFCLDIAVRSVKLGFLQLIAPIPLMMRIDPKKGKQKFGKWVSECVKTFCDVFVRLAAIYFAIFIISAITTDGVQNVAGSANNVQAALVKVAIIFGSLMFAQQIPLLLADIVGGGKEAMQALSKSIGKAESAVGGAVAGFGLGAAANAWAAGRANYAENKKAGDKMVPAFAKSFWNNQGFRSTIAGGASGTYNGMLAGSKAGKPTFAEMKNAGMQGMKISREHAKNRDIYQADRKFQTQKIDANGNVTSKYSPVKAGLYKAENHLDRTFEAMNKHNTYGQLEKEIKDMNIEKENLAFDEHAAREQYIKAQSELSSKFTHEEMKYAETEFYDQIGTKYNTQKEAYDDYHRTMSSPGNAGYLKELSEEDFNKLSYAHNRVKSINNESVKLGDEIKLKSNLQSVSGKNGNSGGKK